MIIPHNSIAPSIGENVFIAPTAVVVGDVTIEEGASIWFNAVLRGDMAPIRIGRNTNIQDNCTVHTDYGKPASIADHVTVGHNAVVHGCTIETGSLIGINAVVLNDAHIMTQSVVAAGAVVREGARFGPRQLIAGTPASVKKALTESMLKRVDGSVAHYMALAATYRC